MTDASDAKRDFFVSFNQADRAWATWIAWVLEEAKYSVWFQDWDFKGSIAAAMEQGHRASTHTLAVLSDSYLVSSYCRAEWEMRFHEDVDGTRGLIVPFRVAPCKPDALLGNLAWRDLFGLDEDAARATLLDRTRQAIDSAYRPGADERRPRFPGATGPFASTTKPRFPVATHNLQPRNPGFVGREDALTAIRETLAADGAVGSATRAYVITGLGGVGKTQTALAYCYHHLADYCLIWWLRAAELATLAANFTTLAGPLGLPEERDQAKAVQAVKAKLQATPGWLLVLDNAEDPATVRPYLPSTNGHALLTSRCTDWQGTAAQGRLDVLSEPEALQLLAGRPDPEALATAELAQAKALAQDLGSLPLALAQARAYLAETGESLGGYRALLRTRGAELLGESGVATDNPEPVARTWDLSLRAAERQCPAARPLLELLAFLAPAALPREALAADPEALPEGLRDKLARNRAVGALHRFSLVRAEGGSITVHRLVQAVTRDGLDAATAKAQAGAAVRLVKAALPRSPREHTNWPAIGALLPHALATAEAAERLEADLETAATVLNQTAVYLYARAAYAEAEPLLKRAIAIGEKALDSEHPNLATRLNNLAELYRAIGRSAEAEPLVKRALAIQEKALGSEHPDVAQSLNHLAVLYDAQGRYSEAELLCQRALAIQEKALGPEHPDVAQSLNNLAVLYRAQGRYSEAEPLYQRALAIREKALGSEHPHVATTLNNLALLYYDTGDYAKAGPLYQRALAISEKTLGPEHPDLATWLNNLALLYYDTGDYAKAEPLYQRAIAINEKILGPEHPNLATRLNNLAVLYQSQGRYTEAGPLYQRALAISEKTLGSEHPDVATSLHNLAELYRAQGRSAEAEPLYQRALAISEKTLGSEHPDVATTLRNLAELYRAQGRSAEAGPLYQRVLSISEKALPPDHPLLDQLRAHA